MESRYLTLRCGSARLSGTGRHRCRFPTLMTSSSRDRAERAGSGHARWPTSSKRPPPPTLRRSGMSRWACRRSPLASTRPPSEEMGTASEERGGGFRPLFPPTKLVGHPLSAAGPPATSGDDDADAAEVLDVGVGL